MPKYMLVLRDDPKEYKNYSPEEFQKLIEKYRAWSGRMSAEGRLVASNKLMDEGGKVMRRAAGKITVKDGPFVETKEIVGGYFIISADSYDHAVKLCDDHPALSHNGIVEIRAVDFMGRPEE